jgi:hypothetical protein
MQRSPSMFQTFTSSAATKERSTTIKIKKKFESYSKMQTLSLNYSMLYTALMSRIPRFPRVLISNEMHLQEKKLTRKTHF